MDEEVTLILENVVNLSTKKELEILKNKFLVLSPISFLLKENLKELNDIIMTPGEDGTYPILVYVNKITSVLINYAEREIDDFLNKYNDSLLDITGETSSLFISANQKSRSKPTSYKYEYKYEKILHYIIILQNRINVKGNSND